MAWTTQRVARLKVEARTDRIDADSDGDEIDSVKEPSVEYALAIDYEHEHRDAEHEHERKPEPGRAPKDGLRGFTNGKSIVRPR